jgi:hypothetical protein
MDWFRKLPGYRRTPPGFERQFMRWVPWLMFAGGLLVALAMISLRIWPPFDALGDTARQIDIRDAQLLTLLAFYWFVVLTMGTAAFIVMLMKGPAYVADAYPLSDADRPSAARKRT